MGRRQDHKNQEFTGQNASHKLKSTKGNMEGSGGAKECRDCCYVKEGDSGFYGISSLWVE